METKFFEYYKYPDKRLDQIWDNCIFVFDTNVLLNFHVYNQQTVKEFLKDFKLKPDRFWIPYHVGKEYHNHLYCIILEQIVAYQDISSKLEESKQKVIDFCNKYSKHPYLKLEKNIQKIESAYDSCLEALKKCEEENPSGVNETEVTGIIKKFFSGRVGDKLSDDEIEKIEKEGEIRYSKKIPPGFEDNSKNENKFGDLIIWNEIIKYSQEIQKPVIFITEDRKDDFWFNISGRTIGPAPSLLREFYEKTGQYYYQYRFDRFLEFYHEKYGVKTDKLILEVQDLNKKKEESDKEKIEDYNIDYKFDSFKNLRHNINEDSPQKGNKFDPYFSYNSSREIEFQRNILYSELKKLESDLVIYSDIISNGFKQLDKISPSDSMYKKIILQIEYMNKQTYTTRDKISRIKSQLSKFDESKWCNQRNNYNNDTKDY
ncbi:hypothetical protein J2128_000538 [Methanomicrobium sp. W14]|uniref:PIN domain-containing protein n=1 Tax=Methanomicrobium sp. W14 TaxID=2817839 RepID=UPI001AEABC43|nr:PIN domain-containing protein [Methanomicrobium sp. W14]MBP2132617.1 hypothetical protein [Methanomicrobium sp. W14]